MTSPAQLDLAYPPTFASSFWTYPDYRTGAIVLYSRIQDGLDENDSVLTLLKHRAEVERETARMLGHIPPPVHTADPLFSGAAASERGGIHTSSTPTARTFRLLVSEFTTSQADVHFRAAKQMEATIVNPFSDWVLAHADRVQESYDVVEAALTEMEKQSAEVHRLRTTYETKCRQADEAEDDARFAPTTHSPNASHTSEDAKTRRLSLPVRREEPEPESSPALDPQRLQRRETLRKQFGFKARREEDEKPRAQHDPDEVPSLQRSSSRISEYFTRAVGKMGESPALAQVRAAMSGLADPRHIRLRREAEAAEQQYQEGVSQLDTLRCRAEETLFHQYQLLQRWESDRIVALQKVLAAYNRAMAPGAEALHASQERTQLLANRLQPSAHLQHLMHENETGSFRPAPVVFRPYYHDDLNAVASWSRAGFGMDLVSTAKGAALAAQETLMHTGQSGNVLPMPTLPPVLLALLSALQRSYADRARWVPNEAPAVPEASVHAEKRRIWLYDVPLHVTHGLRTRLIEHAATQGMQNELAVDAMLDAVDAPVLAATVKLWALELDTPLLPYSFWDEIAEIYDAADIRFAAQREVPEADLSEISTPVLQGVRGVLDRLPKLHLACLDAWIAHLYKLIQDTQTEEPDAVYASKLGLALGRAILRPGAERPSTVHAKYPTLLVKDLVEHYETLFPPLMHTKAKESDMKALSPFRNVPIRRRSTLVDQRISRSSLQSARLPSDGLQRRAAQYEQLHGGRSPFRRHTSLSYRPAQGAERAARTARIASAYEGLRRMEEEDRNEGMAPHHATLPATKARDPPHGRSAETQASATPDTPSAPTETGDVSPTPKPKGKEKPSATEPTLSELPEHVPDLAAPPAHPQHGDTEAHTETSPRMTSGTPEVTKYAAHKPEVVKPKAHRLAAKPPLPKLPVDRPAEKRDAGALEEKPPLQATPGALTPRRLSGGPSVRGPRGPRTAAP